MKNMAYNVTTTNNDTIIETLTIDGYTYEREWVKTDFGCRSYATLDFFEYFENLDVNDETVDFISESFDDSFLVANIFDVWRNE